MGLSSKKTTTNRTENQKVAPYAPAIPFLAGPEDPNLLNEAQRLYKEGVGQSYYPGSAIADYSDPTARSLEGSATRALGGGSGLIPVATDELGKTIQGEYLDANPGAKTAAEYLTPFARGDYTDPESNPYASGIADVMARRIQNSVGSIFGAGNRVGSGAHQDLLAQNVGDATNSLYFDIYNAERGRQMGASQYLSGMQDSAYRDARQNQLNSTLNAPVLEQAGYYNLDRLGQVGSAYDLLNNARADEEAKRYMFEEGAPFDYLDRYADIATTVASLGRQGEGSSSEVTKTSGGALGSILGGALAMGASMYGGGAAGMLGGGGSFNPMLASKMSPAAAGAWGTNAGLDSSINNIYQPTKYG